MDRQYIQEHRIVDRYLNGRLSAEEERAFEEYYLSDPVLLEELELAERLKRAVVSTGEHERGRRGGPFGVFHSPQYAAAASVLLAASLVLASVLYVQNMSLREQGPGFDFASAVTRLVPLVRTRSAAPIEISSRDSNEWTVLEVDVSLADYDLYRVTLERLEGEGAAGRVLELDGLAADGEGYLLVGMPGRLLTPGQYELRVEGRQDAWAAERYEMADEIALSVVGSDPGGR